MAKMRALSDEERISGVITRVYEGRRGRYYENEKLVREEATREGLNGRMIRVRSWFAIKTDDGLYYLLEKRVTSLSLLVLDKVEEKKDA